jgi:hypothetical protein
MLKSTFCFVTSLTVFLSVGASALMAQTVAFDVTRMDDSVEACTDFFQYANGNWIRKPKFPPLILAGELLISWRKITITP